MIETKEEVKVILVKRFCNKKLRNGTICDGEFLPGVYQRGYNIEHICNKCKNEQYFDKKYPFVEYERVTATDDYSPVDIVTHLPDKKNDYM